MDERERWMYDHAGWSDPPGREECARASALAEEKARERVATGDWRYVWKDDPYADDSWMGEEEKREEHTAEVCLLQSRCPCCGTWVTIASCGGIFDADSDYRRVMESDLALEALAREE